MRVALGALAAVLVVGPRAARANPEQHLLQAITWAPCTCILEVTGVDPARDAVGTCRVIVGGVCPVGPVVLSGGSELGGFFGRHRHPAFAAGPGLDGVGAVLLAGLHQEDGRWGLAWFHDDGVDTTDDIGDWMYLLPEDVPQEVARAAGALRRLARRDLTEDERAGIEAMISEVRSPTALALLLLLLPQAAIDGACLYDLEETNRRFHRPPPDWGARFKACRTGWVLGSPAGRARLAWILAHPKWLVRRLPVTCGGALAGGPHRCWGRDPHAIRARLRDDLGPKPSSWQLYDDESGQDRGSLGPAATRYAPGLEIAGHALGFAPGRATVDRVGACLWEPRPGPARHLPAGCPHGQVRTGVVWLPGRGWVVDRPGTPWPGQRPWPER